MKDDVEPVEIDYVGCKHVGSYSVEGEIVTVSTPWGSKSSNFLGLTASLVARLMFRELLDEANRRKELWQL